MKEISSRSTLFSKLIPLTIFLSSFLLFLIQPLLGKFLLPYFGGNSYVWIISLSFFTTVLFLAYFYVFLLTKIKFKQQLLVHLILVFIFLALHVFNVFQGQYLSFIFPSKIFGGSSSVFSVLTMLFFSIFFLFFILATTNSLLQSWYVQLNSSKAPYFLYSLSSLGSILGLFSYPLFFEFFWGNRWQGRIWSGLFWLYLVFLFFIIFLAYRFLRLASKEISGFNKESSNKINSESKSRERTKLKIVLLWLLYSALPVILFLSMTDNISRSIASFPLLWILPLFLYLLSFVIAFKFSLKSIKFELLFLNLALIIFSLSGIFNFSFFAKLVSSLSLVFFLSLLFHSWLYELRPKNLKKIPFFYLIISLGGAIASLITGLLFPLIFNNYYELFIVVFISLMIFSVYLYRSYKDLDKKLSVIFRQNYFYFFISLLMIGSSIFFLAGEVKQLAREDASRGFFGVLNLRYSYVSSPEIAGTYQRKATLVNGLISHGQEIYGYNNSGQGSYYSSVSGLGIALEYLQSQKESLNNGIIGLGAGMTASRNRDTDQMTFYEIDPLAIKIAKERFSYLRGAKGKLNIKLGDARLLIEEELNNEEDPLDFLAIDAFSDDAIPAHLLSQEAFRLYQDRLDEDGILAFHISNRYVNLSKILNPLAYYFSCPAVLVFNSASSKDHISASSWLLFSHNTGFWDKIQAYHHDQVSLTFIDYKALPDFRYWTDDYSNVIPLLKFR